jgi:hypothetical protein
MMVVRRGRPADDTRGLRVARLSRADEARGRLSSPTAVAAEGIRTGIVPFVFAHRRFELPRRDEAILVGDPDDRAMDNLYVGDGLPGGDSPTPDQNGVDDIGRAYGLQEEDTGALRSGAEVLTRRDRHRSELQAPHRREP